MAFIQCEFFSDELGLTCSMNAIAPQIKGDGADAFKDRAEKGFPVLYLLHGLSDNHSTWTRMTSIERYATEKEIAVVMPAVNRSFYANMAYGLRYWNFISEELPIIAKALLPISEDPASTFVAGLSMGGYGAFKLALALPDRYAAAASLSGALDLSEASQLKEERLPDWQMIFGDSEDFQGSENDLLSGLKSFAEHSDPKPRLYQWCGTDDFLYESNLSFLKEAKRLGVEIDYEEGPGEHDWGLWDQQIRRVLDWLPLE